jgi:hypothetical protein
MGELAMATRGRIGKRERALTPELRRAVHNELITPERAARLAGEDAHAAEEKLADPDKPSNNVVVLRVSEIVVDWLVRRNHITRSMWQGATIFREHFDRSGLEQLRAMDMTKDIVDGGQSKPEPMFRDKHLSAFNSALRSLGPLSSPVVTDVVLRDVKPEECRASSHYSSARDQRTETMTKLRDGLARLALHFDLPKDW